MRFILLKLFILFSFVVSAQVTAVQQKALNSYVDYANQSADEVAAVVKSIMDYYPSIHRKSSWGAPRYVCPVQLDDYYFNTAIGQGKNLTASLFINLTARMKDLRTAAGKIDEKCKALDTYHKLEDYKQDNFAKAELLITEIQDLLVAYKKTQNAFIAELEAVHKKLISPMNTSSYAKADNQMRQQIIKEKNFIDSWTLNLKEEVHTGWPVDKLEKSILDTQAALDGLKNSNQTLKYPASSMWTSFQSSLASVLESKRRGLDEYNFEAKKSDAHSNDVYLELINYYNGTLVSDYNTFVQFSMGDNYFGLKEVKYFPVYEIRSQAETVNVEVKPFKDIPRTAVTMTAQKSAITKPVFTSLYGYVDFINETWRQVRYIQSVLENFSSSAAYYKTIDSFDRHGAMHFDYKDYQLPLSHYQKVIADSKTLPPQVARSLNEQSEVLLNILKEIDDLSASLEIEVKEKRYEKDRLEKAYNILERQKVLLALWDDKKELLYQDLRAVYNAYPPANAASSWYVSGKALRDLTDLDHDALFKAKAYYKGDAGITINTDKIDQALREVIAKEYDNMKGIEKIGRSNGLCPYTPYEDLPATSRSFSEALKKMKPVVKASSGYQHPYHTLVYHYNDIVDDYNKFCELSKEVFHLPVIKQPELFALKYPEQKQPANPREPEVTKTVSVQATSSSEKSKEAPRQPVAQTKVLHDTVYIEKRDTVYISEPGEDLRSMEGYATNNMVLLLDVSGSMNAPEKLPLLKSSVLDILSMMRPEDEVSIVAFSGKPKVLLASSSFKEEQKIKKAIEALQSSGKTDGNAALKLAYKVADENYIRGGNNRIILATDGEFALGDDVIELIEKFSKEDIFLTVFNFGKGAGSSKSLEKLAVLGKRNYEHISKENVELKLIREAKGKKKK
jgi:Mg-chelatase subunit ChlD